MQYKDVRNADESVVMSAIYFETDISYISRIVPHTYSSRTLNTFLYDYFLKSQ